MGKKTAKTVIVGLKMFSRKPLSNGGSGFARFWSEVLPLTHYLALQTGQLGGQDVATIFPPILALLAYVLVPGALAWLLIRRQAR